MSFVDSMARKVTGNDCIGCEFYNAKAFHEAPFMRIPGAVADAIEATVDGCTVANVNVVQSARERQANCASRFAANLATRNTVFAQAVAETAKTLINQTEEPFTNFLRI